VLNRTYIDKQSHYEKGGGLSWEGPVTPEQAAPDSTSTAAKVPSDDPRGLSRTLLTPITPLNPEFTADSVRGLDGFDYIWLQFLFHDAIGEGWAQMVRPPRLGGKQKMGVFATRSPHRPNHLGLSLLKLERIETGKPVLLYCSGADLLDGTPTVDIKPYIPFVESKPDASSGFVSGKPEELEVVWLENIGAEKLSEGTQNLISQSIAQDPRPAYQNIPERIYVMNIEDYEVRFQIEKNRATVIGISVV